MRDGYKIVDTDCHQMENQAVWSDYIDAPFKGREPKPAEYKGKKLFCVEGEPVQPPEEEGHYPMHAPEFLEAVDKAHARRCPRPFRRVPPPGLVYAARGRVPNEAWQSGGLRPGRGGPHAA